MKVNIIHNDKSSNVMMDAELLSYIFKRIKLKPTVNHIHTNSYKIEDAIVNIYLEQFNNFHLGKAKYNILIPNFQYFHKNWSELANCFDLIICKTQYCYDIFKDLVDENKLVNIGWRTPDLSLPNIEKEYDQYIVLYNDPYFNELQKLLDIWKLDYPTLNVVFNGVNNPNIKRINLPNINYIEKISSEKFELLFNKCAVHFCLDVIDNFNHSIVQCQLVKSVPVILNKGPALEVVDTDNCFMVSSSKKKNKGGLGSLYKYTTDELQYTLDKIMNTKSDILDIMGNNCKLYSTRNQNMFLEKITNKLSEVFNITKKIKSIKKDTTEIPNFSIITPVYNLPDIFKISVLNYTSTTTNRNNMEWIIVDDSEEGKDVESLLPPENAREQHNIKYIRLKERTDICKKYNIGLEEATHDIILNMSPDDFFYEKGYELIVKELLNSGKQCVGVVQYGCFEINKYISIINVNYTTLPYYLRVYEGSLCYYKSFWKDKNYGDNSQEKGILQHFLEGRYSEFREINWANIFVGLIHTRNSDIRQIDDKQEANGCHFNFTEKLFKYICSLDKQKIDDNEKRQKEIEEIRRIADERDAEEEKEKLRLKEKENTENTDNAENTETIETKSELNIKQENTPEVKTV